MILEIKQTGVRLSPSLSALLQSRLLPLSRFVKRYEKQGELKVFIEIAKTTKHHQKGNIFYVEATVQLPKKLVRADATDASFRTAIDTVRDILKREFVQYKETHDWKL
ncbi:MAG: HPF/RaiA family ribosome-associated protein [bacterium]|nr:HPF/RaiA family ribosome-associated protein [bacterium]